jgi:hypothetical protein
MRRFEFAIGHPGLVEHPLGSLGVFSLGILVGEVDDLPDAALDDCLGTFVAGEEPDIQGATLETTADGV